MSWQTILQFSILILCSTIIVFPQAEKRLDEQRTLKEGKVNSLLASTACSQDVINKKADCSSGQFKDVPNDLNHDLRSLDLSYNLIKELFNSSFRRYSLLEKLYLSNNGISFLEMGTFHPLGRLITLILSDNPIVSLPGSDIFQTSKRLSILSLTNCGLTSFPNETLGFLPQLERLILDRNNLAFINISKCPQITLDKLDIASNQFQEISRDVLKFSCEANTVILRKNNFKKINADAVATFPFRGLEFGFPGISYQEWKNMFTGIAASEITELSLISAEINAIPFDFFDPLRNKKLSYVLLGRNDFECYPSVFANLTSVYKMELSHFPIRILEPDYFHGMKELRSLITTYTEIENINPSGSYWKVDLRELDLSENNLDNLHQYAFRGLTNLTFLDLTGNRFLLTKSTTAFSLLDNLQILNVSGDFITEIPLYVPLLKTFVYSLRPRMRLLCPPFFIPNKTFQYTPYLDHIDLHNSYVQMRELWDSSTNSSLFEGLHNLTDLKLNENRLLEIPSGVFDDLFALQILDLSDCQISTIESGSFASLTSLTNLFLQNNKLQILPLHILDSLVHLRFFMVGDNELFYIDETLFTKTQVITSIDFARNKLSDFNKTTFSPISTTLSSIDLSQNAIYCSCKSQWLIRWLRGPVQVLNEKETICSISSLKPFGGETLVSIEPSSLCTAKFATYASSVFAVIVIVIIIIVILYYYRWKMRYKLFLLRLAILGYREILDENDREDYEFDVHVIATPDDEHWIHDELTPTFQRLLPYYQRNRNVFTEEDLPLGMHRLEAIDHVLTRSYKVLVLLSRAAIIDDWFLTCFRMAMDQVDDTQTENIVVVFLEHIQENEMPLLVRLYMGGQGPYVEWEEEDDDDNEGQEYFWRCLLKCLSVNRKRNHHIPAE